MGGRRKLWTKVNARNKYFKTEVQSHRKICLKLLRQVATAFEELKVSSEQQKSQKYRKRYAFLDMKLINYLFVTKIKLREFINNKATKHKCLKSVFI